MEAIFQGRRFRIFLRRPHGKTIFLLTSFGPEAFLGATPEAYLFFLSYWTLDWFSYYELALKDLVD